MSDDLRLYTVKEVCKLTGLSESFIRHEYNSGRLGCLRLGYGWTIRFTRSHIAEWIASQREYPAKAK